VLGGFFTGDQRSEKREPPETSLTWTVWRGFRPLAMCMFFVLPTFCLEWASKSSCSYWPPPREAQKSF
jgi:hypothetical protein